MNQCFNSKYQAWIFLSNFLANFYLRQDDDKINFPKHRLPKIMELHSSPLGAHYIIMRSMVIDKRNIENLI